MSWQHQVTTLVKRFGPAAKFATKTVLGAVLPGSPALLELAENALDCVRETAEAQLEIREDDRLRASAADLERLGRVLEILNGDLAGLLGQMAELADLPDRAAQILNKTLALDAHAQAALTKLQALDLRFDRLEAHQREMLARQGHAAGMIEQLLPLVRRVEDVAGFVADLRQAGLHPAEFAAALKGFQEAARALAAGRVAPAEAALTTLADAQPQSAAVAVALGAAQAVAMETPRAAQTLARAVRLRPADLALADLHRRVTLAAGTTPSAPPPAPAARLPRVGDALDGWQLEALLGAGGWGLVFQAARGGQRLALKVLHPELSADATLVERFKHEILTLAGLRGHPNLIAIHSFGYATPFHCWYFLMELVQGRSLDAHLARQGAMWPAVTRNVFLAVATGLAAAHEKGIVHRDVKPANVLLSDDGKHKLTDFGLAVQEAGSTLTRAGESAGYTMQFAAPEQLRGRPADARSDVYSLAASLYHALLYADAARREPEHFDEAHVPEAFRAVLAQALHPNPARRPANAGAFRDLLLDVRPAPPPPAPIVAVPAAPADPGRPTAAERAEVQRLIDDARRRPRGLEALARAAKEAFRAGQWAGLRPQVLALMALQPDKGEQLRRVLTRLEGINPTGPVSFTNSVGMPLKLIPAGAFLMGAAPGDPAQNPDELPQHRVTLARGFFLGVHPVTRAQHEAVLGRLDRDRRRKDRPLGGSDHPVEGVRWEAAVAFCRALSDQPAERAAGWRYRLPTEAEWEYACRAGSQTLYSGTNEAAHLFEQAWFRLNSGGRTHPVGTKQPNAWGLYDMLGNVWEWCQDGYDPAYYQTCPPTDPEGPAAAKGHVERGGSCVNEAEHLRAAFRNCRAEPGFAEGPVGFRVACDWALGRETEHATLGR